MASTADSAEANAVMISTTDSGEDSFTALRTSSPPAFGILRSVITRSKSSLSMCAMASSPSEAAETP